MERLLPRAKVAKVASTAAAPPSDEPSLIDVLWDDPTVRDELIDRVMRLERCYKTLSVTKETAIAIIGLEYEEESERLRDAWPLLMPAGFLPAWFFLVVQAYANWKFNVMRPRQGMGAHGIGRCGWGGLWIEISHPNDVLDMYQTAMNEATGNLRKEMFEAMGIDPAKAFAKLMSRLQPDHARYSDNPLVLFPAKAEAIIEGEILRRTKSELTETFIKEWCPLMAPTYMRRRFVQAPEVTLCFDYYNWPLEA